MSLRLQLALVCLSLLLLPWALFLFVGELDKNLREVQLSQSQSDSIAAKKEVDAYLLNSNKRVRPESKTLLSGLINNNILVDAYADDWSAYELHSRRFRYPMNKLSVESEDRELASEFSVHSAVRGNRLFLFVKVQDKDLVYHDPLSRHIASGDQLIIRVPAPDGSIRRYTFRWEAAGVEVGRYYGNTRDGRRPISIANDYRAALTNTASGYHIELSIPLPAEGKFGLSLIDIDPADDVQRWTGMFDPSEEDDVGQLVVVDKKLNELLDAYTEPGMRLRVFDSQGWMIGDADKRMPDAQVERIRSDNRNFIDSLLYRFISWTLRSNTAYEKLPAMDNGRLEGKNYLLLTGLTQAPEFLQDKYGRVFHTSVQEIQKENELVAHFLVQKPRAALTAFTRDAILRLIKIFGFVVLLVAAVLIGFASLLSYRVRKLRNAVELSVTDNGAIIGSVERSSARDEIGDLSRSFHVMIARLKSYTSYLQSLGSRLSHELRTPLSVVATSIEGIDKTALTEEDAAALSRAELGTARLQRLIRNLSEASSVEQTIQRADKSVIDMIDWVKVARDVYDNLYKDREVKLQITGTAEHANVDASVELLHQMLDKLMSNAVDFSPPGEPVSLHLAIGKNNVLLSVENKGPLLAAKGEELFEPMVSYRNNQSQQPHMGFGLHIVKLIADYHQGKCFAHNNAVKNGVVFNVEFNRMPLKAT